MKHINNITGMKEEIAQLKAAKKTIGFVPTMGSLHEGHLQLVEKATQQVDVVIMSIFVNPLQFGENEDFDTYPRDLANDLQLAKQHGVHQVFTPTADDMYPNTMSVTMNVQRGADILCGSSRPGHFDGVATVVMKLFNIIEPDVAYFGMKDAQQVAIIKQMVADYHLNVTIVPIPTVREEDGLAMSSRNVNLSHMERQEAPHIYKTLAEAKSKALQGHFKTVAQLEEWVNHTLKKRLVLGKVDYIYFLKFPSLTRPSTIAGSAILATAVHYEKTRLIDNVTWEQ
ncbi:pantoate--beta-alanine ligase [Salipaludibacillus sp. LMS25]|nr:pantoate--beta-alanine ligase [Salipaludibacillus sp. LMS25]UTR17091.1 pantoate--beta-alanine ligase [Salipaludibacillus sp. LMS25]